MTQNLQQQTAHQQQVDPVIQALRATILWVLEDRKWHPVFDVDSISTFAVLEKDARAQYELSKASEPKTQDDDLLGEAKVSMGETLLFRAALESLEHDGLCKTRLSEHLTDEVRRVRLDKDSRRRIKLMNTAKAEATQQADAWLCDGVKPVGPAVVNGLIRAMTNPQDRYTAMTVAMMVAGWFQEQVTQQAAPKEEKSTDASHVGATALAFPLPTVSLDDCWPWHVNGFFQERQLFYFPAAEANDPTRMMCKALLVDIFSNSTALPPELLECRQEDVAIWLHENWQKLLQRKMYQSIKCELRERPECLDLEKARGSDADGGWVAAIVASIDWNWIAGRLQEECRRHEHRRGKRALELAVAMPFEHIEAKLGDFVGTLQEMFERLVRN